MKKFLFAIFLSLILLSAFVFAWPRIHSEISPITSKIVNRDISPNNVYFNYYYNIHTYSPITLRIVNKTNSELFINYVNGVSLTPFESRIASDVLNSLLKNGKLRASNYDYPHFAVTYNGPEYYYYIRHILQAFLGQLLLGGVFSSSYHAYFCRKRNFKKRHNKNSFFKTYIALYKIHCFMFCGHAYT